MRKLCVKSSQRPTQESMNVVFVDRTKIIGRSKITIYILQRTIKRSYGDIHCSHLRKDWLFYTKTAVSENGQTNFICFWCRRMCWRIGYCNLPWRSFYKRDYKHYFMTYICKRRDVISHYACSSARLRQLYNYTSILQKLGPTCLPLLYFE